MDFTTVSIPKETRDRFLELIPFDGLSKEDGFHWHRAKHGMTLIEQGYTPTTFGSASHGKSEAIKSWIADKVAAGWSVDFGVGQVAGTDGRLSAYWYAFKPNPLGGTTGGGCINLAGKPFDFA